jgi:hypothetical protein
VVNAIGKPVTVSFSRELAKNAAAPPKKYFQKNDPTPLSDREKVCVRILCYSNLYCSVLHCSVV